MKIEKTKASEIGASTDRVNLPIGGEVRTIVAGMKVYELVTKAMKGEGISLDNLAEVVANVTFLGMRDRPSELTIDKLFDWIDDMNVEDRETLKTFILTAMGFIIEEYSLRMAEVTQIINEAYEKSETMLKK